MLPRERFECCYVALLGELWRELESLLAALPAGAAPQQLLAFEARTLALRVELDLLAAAASRAADRGLIGVEQRLRLKAVVADLDWLLDWEPQAVPQRGAVAAIERAQDRLFDEVHGLATAVVAMQQRAAC